MAWKFTWSMQVMFVRHMEYLCCVFAICMRMSMQGAA